MTVIVLHALTKNIGDWTIRTDSPHGRDPKQKRHVHIRKRGMRGEYSWNDDGSRHDQHRFPSSLPCINKAKDLAAAALNIDSSNLTFVTGFDGGIWLRIEAAEINPFSTYVHKGRAAVLFGSDRGLVMVIAPQS